MSTRLALGWLLVLLVLSGLAPTPSATGAPPGDRHAVGTPSASPAGRPRAATPGKPLVLAHYYIWFTPTSWDRAKRDTPLAGRYASDDPAVIRRQIREAESAGIDGFIVSWKSTPSLDETLARVVAVAARQHFKLAITYEGLDFQRNPLPPARIVADLRTFSRRWAGNPVFDIFGRPLVVVSGTPSMTVPAVHEITAPFRDKLLLLASEKDVTGYQQIARYVDGNLYYWSSVNPVTYPSFGAKLMAMATAVRAHHGLWIAPAAPGFDARLVGGHSVVGRRDGATLQAEWNAALQTVPDAIGLISWNEFSENTYVEPSRRYGNRYLRELAQLTGAPAPSVSSFDSDGPPGATGPGRAFVVLASFGFVTVVFCGIAVARTRSAQRTVSAR